MSQKRWTSGSIGALAAVVSVVVVAGCGDTGSPSGEAGITKSTTRIASVDLVNPDRDTTKTCLAPTIADPGASDPQRILVTDPAFLDALCALGVQTKVVGTATRGPIPAYLGPSVASLPQLGNAGSVDEAKAAAAKPDVVLSSGDGALADRIKARSVVIDPKLDWKATFLAVAAGVNRSAAGRDRINEFFGGAKNIGSGPLGTSQTQASLVRFGKDNETIEGTASFAGQVLTALGVQRPVKQRIPGPTAVTDKNFADADADLIYVSFSDSDQSHGKDVLKSGKWLDMGAPSWRRVLIVDDGLWYGSGGLAAAWLVLGDIQRSLNTASK